MTLTTPYSATFIVGDGETKTFSYLFEEVSPNFISVMVYNSLTGLISTPTYIIDTDQKQVIFGEDTPAPTADETVCIYRNTPNVQDVAFRTLHGYDAQTLENILSKIVAMIQEIKSNYFSTQVLQGDPWQLDLLSSEDDGATVNIDYTAKKLVKGLYFRITSGNLQVSADGTNYITMPKSADVVEFRQHETVKEDLTVEYRLQYRVGNTWYNAESNAESTANEALQIAQDAKDIAQDTSEKVDAFDARLTIAESDASDAKQNANDAKELAEDTAETVSGFDSRITQAEQNANDAKSMAQTTSGNLTTHIGNTNNPHQVTKVQVGLGNVDNTSDIDKPISTATQNALGLKANSADLGTAAYTDSTDYATAAQGVKADSAVQPGNLATVATTGSYNDLSNKPTIPTVGNGTIIITQGGTPKGTFTTNQGGNTTIDLDAGGGGSSNYHPDLFDWKWADHQLNDVQWLRGDTFSWQSGSVYEAAYAHLEDDIIGAVSNITVLNTGTALYETYYRYTDGDITGYYAWELNGVIIYTENQIPSVGDVAYISISPVKTFEIFEIAGLQSETIAGITIQFYLADDGHKICPASEESNVVAIYTATGVAWYYIIDTTNERFKLPRTKFGFTGLRDTVGNYVEPGLPNITGYLGLADRSHNAENRATGCFSWNNQQGTQGKAPSNDSDGYDAYFDASQSNVIYGANTTVQPPATQMYLYFYVGEFTQTALENTAGITTEEMNNKVNIGHEVIEFQAPTAANNYTWYRKYADGWVEQGGITTAGNIVQSIVLPVTMADTNYTISAIGTSSSSNNNVSVVGYENVSTTGFDTRSNVVNGQSQSSAASSVRRWQVSGMAAS